MRRVLCLYLLAGIAVLGFGPPLAGAATTAPPVTEPAALAQGNLPGITFSTKVSVNEAARIMCTYHETVWQNGRLRGDQASVIGVERMSGEWLASIGTVAPYTLILSFSRPVDGSLTGKLVPPTKVDGLNMSGVALEEKLPFTLIVACVATSAEKTAIIKALKSSHLSSYANLLE